MMMAKQGKATAVPRLRFPEFRKAAAWSVKSMDGLYSFMRNNSLSRDKLNYESGSAKNIHYGDIHTKFPALFDITKEDVPYVNSTEEIPGTESEDYCVEGDVIFADASEDMKDVGKSMEIVRLAGEQLLSGQHTILARRKDDTLVVGFGGHLFRSGLLRSRIEKEAQGTKVYQISSSRLGGIDITFPGDKDEQQKIADCLTSLDEVIAAQGRKVEALKAHKRGLMQQLFPRKGETLPRLRFSEEGDWVLASLPDVAFYQEGPGIMAVDFRAEGVPLVRLAGVGGLAVTLDGCNRLDPKMVAQKWEHFRLVANDLVISTSATFGRSSRVTDVAAGAVFYTGLIRFRPIDERLSRSYLEVFLGSPHFLGQAELAAEGGGIKHFGPTHLKKMEIWLPPLDEQRRIADCLSSLDIQIASETDQLAALKTHKQGLMQQLFPAPETTSA